MALSLLWVLGSICLIVYGFRHCSVNAFTYRLDCAKDMCTLVKFDKQYDLDVRMEFLKADLMRADAVRIDSRGEYADNLTMKKNKNERYGHSVRMTVRTPADEGSKLKVPRDVILTPRDMNRRPSRTGSSRVSGFIAGNKPTVSVNASSVVTLVGIFSILGGIASLVMACLFGQWKDKAPLHKRGGKKAS